jgi:hypothetical protein
VIPIIMIVFLCILSLFDYAYADRMLVAPVVDQDFMESTLHTDYSCGARTWVENVAFWDSNGFPNLADGVPSGTQPDNSQYMIDLYELGLIESGFNGSVTYPAALRTGLEDWFQYRGYDATVIQDTSVTWSEVTGELQAGRPVPMVLYGANHWVTAIGWTSNPQTMTFLWGHLPYVRTYTRTQVISMGPMEALYVRPSNPVPVPDPTTQPWYDEAKVWCDANGYEIEVRD